jgi:hypothetical protein
MSQKWRKAAIRLTVSADGVPTSANVRSQVGCGLGRSGLRINYVGSSLRAIGTQTNHWPLRRADRLVSFAKFRMLLNGIATLELAFDVGSCLGSLASRTSRRHGQSDCRGIAAEHHQKYQPPNRGFGRGAGHHREIPDRARGGFDTDTFTGKRRALRL